MILSTGFSHAEAIYMNNDDQQPRPSRHFKCMWTILARTGPTFMTTASTRVRLHMCRTVPPHAATKTPRDASACIRSPPGAEATEPPPPSRSRAPLGCCGPSHVDVWAASTARARQHESASAHLAVGPAPPACAHDEVRKCGPMALDTENAPRFAGITTMELFTSSRSCVRNIQRGQDLSLLGARDGTWHTHRRMHS